MWDATLEILIAETAKGGELIKHLDRTLNLRLNRAQRDELMREGFSMTRTIERSRRFPVSHRRPRRAKRRRRIGPNHALGAC
jgi:hypothetical protein